MEDITITTEIKPDVSSLIVYKGILVFNKENKFIGFVNYNTKTVYDPIRTSIDSYWIVRINSTDSEKLPSLELLFLRYSKSYNFKQL